MRFLPRSLFARMVLVLLAGLIVAQLLSFAVHWRERGEYMTRSMGMRSAARIADKQRCSFKSWLSKPSMAGFSMWDVAVVPCGSPHRSPSRRSAVFA